MRLHFQSLKWLALFLLMVYASAGQSLPENGPKLKREAFLVLQSSCNPCHKKLNPSKVFDSETMETYAPLIVEQVFVEQRMPLGFWNKLESADRERLRLWLEEFLQTEIDSE